MTYEQALEETCAAFYRSEYEVGRNDCCLFVLDYCERMGMDISVGYSKTGGLRTLALKALGEAVRSVLGEPSEAIAPGDIALVGTSEGLMPGVYNGHYVVVYSESGIGRTPTDSIEASWCHKRYLRS